MKKGVIFLIVSGINKNNSLQTKAALVMVFTMCLLHLMADWWMGEWTDGQTENGWVDEDWGHG